MTRRVVVTGIGVVTPLGHSPKTLVDQLLAGASGVRAVPELAQIRDLRSRRAAPCIGADLEFRRKRARGLGRVGRLALRATDDAIAQSGLDQAALSSGRVGLYYGSTHGSSAALESFARKVLVDEVIKGISPTAYLKFMSNTCAANLAQALAIRGRVLATTSACTSASQAVGLAYEAVRDGVQDAVICGGADELHRISVAVFDIMLATSTSVASESPRPFDQARDGLIVGEGAATLVLEARDRAIGRGATIYGEVLGFGTNCDGSHITSPARAGMVGAMGLALADAGLAPSDVAYICAHATATEVGDIEESHATAEVFGRPVPISSLKGHLGHTLGACGGIELAACLAFLERGEIAGTLNLQTVDPRCADLDYRRSGDSSPLADGVIMTNNFAFGGVNTSLIVGR